MNVTKNPALAPSHHRVPRRGPEKGNVGAGPSPRRSPVGAILLAGLVLGLGGASAFPPTPDHTFYGTIRNEWGDAITANGARVFIVTTNGPGASAPIAATVEAGINYYLPVPMDSGRSFKVESPSAERLRASQPFQLKVQIGPLTYLPIEMTASRPIGQPAGTTRLDLTLGVDTDGDGLPDAWELANGLNPNDPTDGDGDADGDGISNRNEYLAGTYPFDPNDGFRLALVSQNVGNATLEFLAISGRTYTIQSSFDLQQWTTESFRIVTGGVPGAPQNSYSATDVRMLRAEVPAQPGVTNRFFKATVQ